MTRALRGRMGRYATYATAGLLLLTVVTSCTTRTIGAVGGVAAPTPGIIQPGDAATAAYPDAPLEITARWWLAPDVAAAPPSDDPQDRAAARVLQSFFGSDSTGAMLAVSVGPARVFAEFMIVMEEISGRHPMEEVISRRVPRVADRRLFPELLIDGEITEDRSTGSGNANRTTYDQFVMRSGSDGQLRLVDFRRDGEWISDLEASGADVESAGNGAMRIVAVVRSPLGRYMVAGMIGGSAPARWSLGDARLESIDGSRQAGESFSEVGVSDPGNPTPFLITFVDGGLGDDGARLILPPLDADSPRDLSFELPPLGVSRDGGGD